MAGATVYLTVNGIVEPKDFVNLTGMSFVYYFTKQPTQPSTQSPSPVN